LGAGRNEFNLAKNAATKPGGSDTASKTVTVTETVAVKEPVLGDAIAGMPAVIFWLLILIMIVVIVVVVVVAMKRK
jgi:hypothetical protein